MDPRLTAFPARVAIARQDGFVPSRWPTLIEAASRAFVASIDDEGASIGEARSWASILLALKVASFERPRVVCAVLDEIEGHAAVTEEEARRAARARAEHAEEMRGRGVDVGTTPYSWTEVDGRREPRGARAVLTVLAEAEPLTSAQIAGALGWKRDIVSKTLRRMGQVFLVKQVRPVPGVVAYVRAT